MVRLNEEPIDNALVVRDDIEFFQETFNGLKHSPIAGSNVLNLIWRRRYGIVSMFIALSLAGFVCTFLFIKTYFVATTLVLLQNHTSHLTDNTTPSGRESTDAVVIQTQVDILKSAELTRAVVRKLNLTDRPEFMPKPGLVARILVALYPNDEGEQNGPAPSQAQREEMVAGTLAGMTSITSSDHSYVIAIRVKTGARAEVDLGRAKALSAELANAYADAYVDLTRRVKSDSMRRASGLFDDRLSSLQDQMRAAERAVQTYRVETGLIENRAIGGANASVTIASQQMAQLNADLISATGDRARKEASLNQLSPARAGRESLASIPEVVASPVIQKLREQQAELGAKEASLATTYNAAFPELAAVRASGRDVASKIDTEISTIAESLRHEVDTASARESALRAELAHLQGQVAGQGQNEVNLKELQNEADTARMIYAEYLKRSAEATNLINTQEPDALVASRAVTPVMPAAPTVKQVMGAVAIASLLFSILAALARERMQPGFQTAEQMESSIGTHTIGMVPRVRSSSKALAFSEMRSQFSESIISTRARLRHNMRRGPRVVMITSALPGEGKTFVSLSLARNAAMAGERVLLIDCDLRRATVARTIMATVGPNATRSGADYNPSTEFDIQRDKLTPLHVLTLMADPYSPQDLFAAQRMRDLIEDMRSRYDFIFLDTPPLLSVIDAQLLSRLVDCSILVVRWTKTPRQCVSKAMSMLRSGGASTVCSLMNQVDFEKLAAIDGSYTYAYGKRYCVTNEPGVRRSLS